MTSDSNLWADLRAAVPLGSRRRGRSRTITAGEIRLLAAVSEFSSLSSIADADADADAVDEIERLPLNSHLLLPVVVSLAAANPLFRDLEQVHHLSTVAAMRQTGRFGARVVAGDTITVDSEVSDLRPSASRPGHYVASIHDTAINQDGSEVLTIHRVLLLRHDPSAAAEKDVP
jgi:hypothetical protein